MTKYTRDLGESFKHDSFVVALDYRASSKSSYAMSCKILQQSFLITEKLTVLTLI